jgi:hypothetical protein
MARSECLLIGKAAASSVASMACYGIMLGHHVATSIASTGCLLIGMASPKCECTCPQDMDAILPACGHAKKTDAVLTGLPDLNHSHFHLLPKVHAPPGTDRAARNETHGRHLWGCPHQGLACHARHVLPIVTAGRNEPQIIKRHDGVVAGVIGGWGIGSGIALRQCGWCKF